MAGIVCPQPGYGTVPVTSLVAAGAAILWTRESFSDLVIAAWVHKQLAGLDLFYIYDGDSALGVQRFFLGPSASDYLDVLVAEGEQRRRLLSEFWIAVRIRRVELHRSPAHMDAFPSTEREGALSSRRAAV